MRYKFKISFLAFIVSFIVLFPVGVFFVINYGFDVKSKSVDSRFEYVIPKENDLNILFVGCSNLNERFNAEVFVLVKISAHSNEISLLSIPANLKMIFEGRVFSLCNCFSQGTIDYLKKALESFFDFPPDTIDRFVVADFTAIEGIINKFHGIKITNNKKLNFDYNLPVAYGRKVIGGDCFCKILKRNPKEALKLLGFDFFNRNNLRSFFVYSANMFKSNISPYDFEFRKKGFEELIRKKKEVLLIEPKLELKKIGNCYKITDDSKVSCQKAFVKLE